MSKLGWLQMRTKSVTTAAQLLADSLQLSGSKPVSAPCESSDGRTFANAAPCSLASPGIPPAVRKAQLLRGSADERASAAEPCCCASGQGCTMPNHLIRLHAYVSQGMKSAPAAAAATAARM